MTETEFTDEILKWAKIYKWRRFHVRGNTRRLIQGDNGLPDLILLRPPRLIFAELKVGKNKPSQEQIEWLRDLACVRGRDDLRPPRNVIETHVWYPEMWSGILATLTG